MEGRKMTDGMESLFRKPAIELRNLIRSKNLSPVELIDATLRRIEAVNPPINAFVALRADDALEEAKALAEDIAAGKDPGPLAGIPIGVKDMEDTHGMVTSFGSIPFKDNFVQQDSIQVARLKKAGAIVVGKTNTPEFGFTGFTKNRLYGVTGNPWNPERTPGGSSGGAAAAVAGCMVPLATGSDAGGSIRIPASYCGCFGFKPSYGRIPLGPLPALHMSRTWHLGPLSRTVTDAALYLDCVAGYHPKDPDSLPPPNLSYVDCLGELPAGLKIGFSPDLGYARVQKDLAAVVNQALKAFEDLGHTVDIWDGKISRMDDAWSKLMTYELYAIVHNRLDDIREEMGRTLVYSLDQAKKLDVYDFIEIQKARAELNDTLAEFFTEFDFLLTPTMPTEAFAAKGPPPAEIDGHPINLLDAVAFTYPFNLSGHPAATVRAGLTANGLPVGLQIIGPKHRDERVLQATYAYEQIRPWNDLWPSL
jgi:aspartyl-tRNA(Asn)/glutamyl-tRNA(Gln) amidotransferase subunit A